MYSLRARCKNLRDSRDKSFLLLFFKKAGLAFFLSAESHDRVLHVTRPTTLATASTVRRTSGSRVRQLTTLMRIARRPRNVVPLK